ncbi:hypothetical protein D7044_27260 [Micromonospora musae]|uniref:Uncharacterized protein n=1 Tax=Micromonospora musae TaxID=1894970 RepID=A0A3A9XTW0_9ACTN|nr:hypothetical protein D7044_27260 [Micromonospora musae]
MNSHLDPKPGGDALPRPRRTAPVGGAAAGAGPDGSSPGPRPTPAPPPAPTPVPTPSPPPRRDTSANGRQTFGITSAATSSRWSRSARSSTWR